MSIGEVLAALQPDFPDVSVSKIRLWETEGLVEPARTPSGYRKFSPGDVERLRYAMTLQRDHYWPLRRIRAHLDAVARGAEQPVAGASGPRRVRQDDDEDVPFLRAGGRSVRLRADPGAAGGAGGLRARLSRPVGLVR
jgi:DNA-binding transcriptional MerR regulator